MNNELTAQLYDYDGSINIHKHLLLCNEVVFIFIYLFVWLTDSETLPSFQLIDSYVCP